MNKEIIIFNDMINNKYIPEGIFQIEEMHLQLFLQTYHKFFGKINKKCGKQGNIRFARRLAGRSLLNLNFERGARFNEIKSGLIYLIKNKSNLVFIKLV